MMSSATRSGPWPSTRPASGGMTPGLPAGGEVRKEDPAGVIPFTIQFELYREGDYPVSYVFVFTWGPDQRPVGGRSTRPAEYARGGPVFGPPRRSDGTAGFGPTSERRRRLVDPGTIGRHPRPGQPSNLTTPSWGFPLHVTRKFQRVGVMHEPRPVVSAS